MYSSKIIANNIKNLAAAKKISTRLLLQECGLGRTTLSMMADDFMPRCDSLAKIADCLGCSVDYLLGRTTSNSVTL